MLNQTTFSITELAREFAVTTRTIRFYEDQSLLQPARRGTTRIYSKGDRTRLKLVLRGRRIGWSVAEIREVIALYDDPGGERKQLETMIGKLQDNRDTLLQQQEDIHLALADLQRLEQNCFSQLDALAEDHSATNTPGSARVDTLALGHDGMNHDGMNHDRMSHNGKRA